MKFLEKRLKTLGSSSNASQKCYGDCWADAFRNQAENDIKKFEEWKLRQDMEV